MEQGTIKVDTGFSFLQFLLYLFKPVISIDGGEPKKVPWGQSEHCVSPGQHTVNIAISYFFGWQVSKGSETVDVGANQTVTLKYRAPLVPTWDANLQQV
jgi:hypothetical protein